MASSACRRRSRLKRYLPDAAEPARRPPAQDWQSCPEERGGHAGMAGAVPSSQEVSGICAAFGCPSSSCVPLGSELAFGPEAPCDCRNMAERRFLRTAGFRAVGGQLAKVGLRAPRTQSSALVNLQSPPHPWDDWLSGVLGHPRLQNLQAFDPVASTDTLNIRNAGAAQIQPFPEELRGVCLTCGQIRASCGCA